MKKVKYFYNIHTLRYEKLITPVRVIIFRIFGFIASSLVTAGIIAFIAFRFSDYSPRGKKLLRENTDLKYSYTVLSNEISRMRGELGELETRDNEIYRAIFEASPLPDSIREKEKIRRNELDSLYKLSDNRLIRSITDDLAKLSGRMASQNKSYEAIDGMVKNKENMMACIPAIQPVSNKNLNRIASGFGTRIDPMYKVRKKHEGLDFAAPQGTPIYATADGNITKAEFNASGFGNHVVINHGYGYETLYAHMIRIKASVGNRVKRGEVIGWVGNTGKSFGAHCHYEVHKNGTPVDPIYYFYNDLTPEQYDRVLKHASSSNQSFD